MSSADRAPGPRLSGGRRGRRLGSFAALAVIVLLASPRPAHAVEYRLQVVSVFWSAFTSFLEPGEMKDGAGGRGLDQLEASLDAGRVSKGALLFDRRVQPAAETLGRAYGGVRVNPEMKPGGDGAVAWDEVTWDGKPGERSVWVVSPRIRNIQELYDTALKGSGTLRHFQPYGLSMNGARSAAVSLPLNFLWFHEERGTAWDKYLSRGLDLGDGIGVVVGVNPNALFPDQAYLIVSHAAQPASYKAVLVWRERNAERQAPGNQTIIVR
jgi:hypothetical protein